ncbi:MAG: hypothetical protein NVSMB65_06010 [Chloroflexota bacterium]
MAERDLCALTIGEAAGAIRSRDLSPVELTRALLARVDALDAQVRAFLHVDAGLALAQAREAERALMGGHQRGPLHGVPIAVKDIVDVAGLPTTAASRWWRWWRRWRSPE